MFRWLSIDLRSVEKGNFPVVFLWKICDAFFLKFFSTSTSQLLLLRLHLRQIFVWFYTFFCCLLVLLGFLKFCCRFGKRWIFIFAKKHEKDLTWSFTFSSSHLVKTQLYNRFFSRSGGLDENNKIKKKKTTTTTNKNNFLTFFF